MIYLYLKTHNSTGLKYLGKTTAKDPFKYRGSGIKWLNHLENHGNDVSTEILFETECKDALREMGLHYSLLWDIVESKEFANMTDEEGQGGYTSYSEERNNKISKAHKGRKAPWVKKGLNKGKVTAYNVITKENVSITQEEFQKNDNLVGVAKKNAGKPKSEEWKNSRKKAFEDNPKQGNTIEYNGKRYISMNEMIRETGFGKGRIYGMIKRQEAVVVSKINGLH